jgi:hypothetical protein
MAETLHVFGKNLTVLEQRLNSAWRSSHGRHVQRGGTLELRARRVDVEVATLCSKHLQHGR